MSHQRYNHTNSIVSATPQCHFYSAVSVVAILLKVYWETLHKVLSQLQKHKFLPIVGTLLAVLQLHPIFNSRALGLTYRSCTLIYLHKLSILMSAKANCHFEENKNKFLEFEHSQEELFSKRIFVELPRHSYCKFNFPQMKLKQIIHIY